MPRLCLKTADNINWMAATRTDSKLASQEHERPNTIAKKYRSSNQQRENFNRKEGTYGRLRPSTAVARKNHVRFKKWQRKKLLPFLARSLT